MSNVATDNGADAEAENLRGLREMEAERLWEIYAITGTSDMPPVLRFLFSQEIKKELGLEVF